MLRRFMMLARSIPGADDGRPAHGRRPSRYATMSLCRSLILATGVSAEAGPAAEILLVNGRRQLPGAGSRGHCSALCCPVRGYE